HLAGEDLAEGTGEDGQTSLGYRTGLRGTEAGVGIRTLRRTRLAWLSPSRHLMYRGLWVPGGRTEPFFPLCPRRPCWIISPGVAAELPPPRVAAFAPNVITRTRSPRCE